MCSRCWMFDAGCWETVRNAASRHPDIERKKHLVKRSALRELEPLARLRTARFLALHRTRIAREEAKITELPAVSLVDLHEGARHRETERAGLAGVPAAVNVRLHVIASE